MKKETTNTQRKAWAVNDTFDKKPPLYLLPFDKFLKNSSYIPTENTDREREKRLKKYYGTHRYTSFKHDHWRDTLSLKSLQEINSNSDCQKVLRLLSYKP